MKKDKFRTSVMLLIILIGSATWFTRNDVTPLLFGGRSFEARSGLIQLAILLLLFLLYSLLFVFFVAAARVAIQKGNLIILIDEVFVRIRSLWILFIHAMDKFFLKFKNYLRENSYPIVGLSLIALFAYGFELFNLNLTIDEEVHATYIGPTLSWLSQGRWGMYLLNRFLFPYTVVPVMPLLVALLFHIVSILLLLKGWGIRSKNEQLILGSVSIASPIMAYIYTFSTINFGIGIGLFCISLSLIIYTEGKGMLRLFSFIPASFAIAIYQGLLPALVGVFLVRIIIDLHLPTIKILTNILVVIFIHLLALFLYYSIQKFIIVVGIIPSLSYVNEYFDVVFLREHFGTVLYRVWNYLVIPVYFGKMSIYGIDVSSLGWCVGFSLLGAFFGYFRSRVLVLQKYLASILFIGLLFLPFISSLLMQGLSSMRFMISLSVVLPGIIMFGMQGGRGIREMVALLTIMCVFQFLVATNHLFASSHLALQADRSLATRLIGKIEDAQSEAGVDQVKYMEIIGYYERPSTPLIPKIETFGASFFEWNQGTTFRILPFLQTLGYSFQPLPMNRRVEMVTFAESMPAWPQSGSVKVIGDVVLVKFGPYSLVQKTLICKSEQNIETALPQDFCK